MKRISFLAAVLALAACGGGSSGNAGSTTTVDHRAVLADHEVPDLAVQLVAIPGYSYVDPPATEIAQGLAVFHEIEQRAERPGLFTAVSFHGVVADDRTQNHSHTAGGGVEVGYLTLNEFAVAPPAGLEDDQNYFIGVIGKEVAAPTRLDLSDTSVFKFDDPSAPDSRFVYLWIRHGVEGYFDGADAASMERWLGRYLSAPALSPNESPELAHRVIPLAGFVYVNATEIEALSRAIVDAFGAVPSALHKVADGVGSIGVLSLAELEKPLAADEAAMAVFGNLGLPVGDSKGREVAGVQVFVFQTSEGVLYSWATGNVVALFSANREPAGQTFVEALLYAWRANGMT